MNPHDFQNAVIAWIGVGTILLPIVAAFIGKMIGTIQATQAEIKGRQDRQSARIDTALVNTPAPGQASAVTVTAPAATTQTVETGPQNAQNGAGGASLAVSPPAAPPGTPAPVSGAVNTILPNNLTAEGNAEEVADLSGPFAPPALAESGEPFNPNKTNGFTPAQLGQVETPVADPLPTEATDTPEVDANA